MADGIGGFNFSHLWPWCRSGPSHAKSGNYIQIRHLQSSSRHKVGAGINTESPKGVLILKPFGLKPRELDALNSAKFQKLFFSTQWMVRRGSWTRKRTFFVALILRECHLDEWQRTGALSPPSHQAA